MGCCVLRTGVLGNVSTRQGEITGLLPKTKSIGRQDGLLVFNSTDVVNSQFDYECDIEIEDDFLWKLVRVLMKRKLQGTWTRIQTQRFQIRGMHAQRRFFANVSSFTLNDNAMPCYFRPFCTRMQSATQSKMYNFSRNPLSQLYTLRNICRAVKK